MKWIVLILFLFCRNVYGQRYADSIEEALSKGDSLELLYANDSLSKIITDTLPLYTLDETDGWRDMKLVTYFYDYLNVLKKISFRNGREGYYFFYFEGAYLRKIRVLKQANLINVQYYFTGEDNRYTLPEIEQRAMESPEKKEAYQLLKMSRAFFNKFRTLL